MSEEDDNEDDLSIKNFIYFLYTQHKYCETFEDMTVCKVSIYFVGQP